MIPPDLIRYPAETTGIVKRRIKIFRRDIWILPGRLLSVLNSVPKNFIPESIGVPEISDGNLIPFGNLAPPLL